MLSGQIASAQMRTFQIWQMFIEVVTTMQIYTIAEMDGTKLVEGSACGTTMEQETTRLVGMTTLAVGETMSR